MKRLAARAARKLLLPLIPRRLRLPLRYRLHLLEGTYENELRYLQRVVPAGTGMALDIGANEGMFSYRLSGLFPRVCAFEPNDEMTGDLRAYGHGIEVIQAGLSSTAGTMTLYIPISKEGHPLDGWASLSPGNAPGVDEHRTKRVEIRTLDSFELGPIGFVKIDVEGYEMEVLEGGRETIARHRPVVLVEVKDRNLDRVRTYFDQLGYDHARLSDLIGIPGSLENHYFLPRRKGRPS